MTYFENNWGYKCPIALETIPDGVRFITAELGEGSGVSASKILMQYFVDKPYSFVSTRNRPCIRIDEIRWSSDYKSCYEVVIEGDFLQVALSVINNGYEPFFGKCIWEVPSQKLTTYDSYLKLSTFDISAVGVDNLYREVAKKIIQEMPMDELNKIFQLKMEDGVEDKYTKIIRCSIKI